MIANIILIALIISLIGLIGCLIMLYRNIETCDLKVKITNDLYRRHCKDIRNGIKFEVDYEDLPSYDSILFSFKSFKVKNFLTQEQFNYIYG